MKTYICALVLAGAAAVTTAGTTKDIIDPENPGHKPDGAVQLVGEKEHLLVPAKEGDKSKWVFADGILTASPKWDSLVTKEDYGDFRLHVEFNVNEKENPRNLENNGNSGVYLQKRYEVQILNSFGIDPEKYKKSYCGCLYKLKEPDKIASKPAGEWQSYDIVFRGARFEGEKKTADARITVYHNGELIHDDFAIPRKTGAGAKEGPEPGPILFQGHENPVKFRNVWIQALDLK